jgi:HlyD family secretion protein
MSRRFGQLAAAAALVAVLGLAAVWAARHLGPEPGPFTVTGTIEAIQVDISPRITGRIVERTVREGQPVARGQLLARLDDEQLTAELRAWYNPRPRLGHLHRARPHRRAAHADHDHRDGRLGCARA